MKKQTVFILILFVFCLGKQIQAQQPNFIILLGDDISANSIGCYGSENKGTTPHIDQLASQGIMFTNMFVSEAICAPTRAELYTGKMPFRNGVTANNLGAHKGTKSIVHYLEDLGYRVALTGKKHYKPASVFPFRYIEGFTEKANDRGYQLKEDWPALESFIKEEPEKPFCLIICSVNAHAPWDAGDSDQWKLSDIVLPPHFVDNKVTRHFYREQLAEVKLFDDQVGKANAMIEHLKLSDNTVLMVLDENGTGMPGGKWTNYDWGVRSACVMKWPDRYKAKFETDAIAQYCDILPTIIDAAGGKVSEDLDGSSLMPLILNKTQTHRENAFFVFAQKRDSEYNQSRAVFNGKYKLIWNISYERDFFVGVINGFEKEGKLNKMLDRHVSFMYSSWVERAKIDEDAKEKTSRFKKHPEFELYNLELDPWEMNNLASQEEYLSMTKQMLGNIKQWMSDQGDVVNCHAVK